MKRKKSLLGSFLAELALLVASAVLASCASKSLPLPAITSISPTSVRAGGAGFTLKVLGTGFLSTDVVEWNGQILATQSVSSTELDAQVPASLIAVAAQVKPGLRLASLEQRHAQGTPGQTGDVAVDITVLQKPPGSVVSNTFMFAITPSNPTPVLTITKTHSGNFTQGQTGATFNITVGNAGTAPTDGSTVTATELPPSSLTVTALSGTGWTCVLTSLTCTRSDALAAESNYPVITVTATVATNAPATITNSVSISGGGSTSATGSDTATVNPPPAPALKITKTHTGNFTQGQTGAQFAVTVSNSGTGPTNGAVTATDTTPSSLTITAITGTGWACTVTTGSCTRSDALAAGSSYPAITVTVSVATNAPTSVTNSVSVSGGGSTTGTGSDTVTINSAGTPALSVTKTHTGSFTQGQTGATFTVTVKNSGTGPTSGTVTASDAPPAGLTITGLSGTGWACTVTTASCTRSDALAAGSSYSAITVTVTVATNAPASVTNTVSVSGGGATSTAMGSDTATVTAAAPVWTIVKTHVGTFTQGGTGMYTIAVSNSGNGPTSGAVTVSDTLPTGLTEGSASGTGWSCSPGGPTVTMVTCTRSDALPAGGSYPSITIDVVIATNAPASVTNTAVISGGGVSTPATAMDTATVSSGAATGLFITQVFIPSSVPGFTNVNAIVKFGNNGGTPISGVSIAIAGLPFSSVTVESIVLVGATGTCTITNLTCTLSGPLPAGSDPIVILTFQAVPGTANIAGTATVSASGATSAHANFTTSTMNCTPGPGVLCGQYLLFVQGYGPDAMVVNFVADGAGHLTGFVVDSTLGSGMIALTSGSGYTFDSNGLGNLTINTMPNGAFNYVFKFALDPGTGTSGSVIEYDPNGATFAPQGGMRSGSGFLQLQTPAYYISQITGSYGLALIGARGLSTVRVGMLGAFTTDGNCGVTSTGSTGIINDGGTLSRSVSFSGTLGKNGCFVGFNNGQGLGTFSSISGTPGASFATVNFNYFILDTNPDGTVNHMLVVENDTPSASAPRLGGILTRQNTATFNTKGALDCALGTNLGCVFALAGATGGDSVTGNSYVQAGLASITTQSNTAGALSALRDENNGGTVKSGTVTATYSYNADGTGSFIPPAGEVVDFILTDADTGYLLSEGTNVSFGFFAPESSPHGPFNSGGLSSQSFDGGTRYLGTTGATTTVGLATATQMPTGTNTGALSGNIAFWNTSTHQNSSALTGTYTADPLTTRVTGTTNIAGAASFAIYQLGTNQFVLVGTTSGDTKAVLMIF